MDPGGVFIALVAGLVAGATSGLFGVGGGVIMVPVLHYLLGMPFRLATMVSLFVITVNAPFGLHRQHRHGNVRWHVGAVLAAGGLVGVQLGMLVRPWLTVAWLKVLFAAVMAFAAYRLVRRATAHQHENDRVSSAPPGEHHVPNANVVLAAGGVLAGAAAHLLGIGGGLLMVPVLVFTGLGIHAAVATSLVAVFTNAAVSTLFDLAILVHHLEAALPLALGAVVGIHGGVHLANRLPAATLRRGFGVFLGLMALGILLDGLGVL